jgi:IS30 family transposase
MAGGERGNERHEAARRRDEVVALRDEGLTFRQIAVELGICHQTVWQRYQRAMRERPIAVVHAKREQARKEEQDRRVDEQLTRIDMQREQLLEILQHRTRTVVTATGKRVEAVEDDTSVLAAIDRLVKLDDQEAKLLALYPKQEVSHGGEITYRLIDGG